LSYFHPKSVPVCRNWPILETNAMQGADVDNASPPSSLTAPSGSESCAASAVLIACDWPQSQEQPQGARIATFLWLLWPLSFGYCGPFVVDTVALGSTSNQSSNPCEEAWHPQESVDIRFACGFAGRACLKQ